MFVHIGSSGKLRIFIDLSRVNPLCHDYLGSKFPISTLKDATILFAETSLFHKLDCSQAYFCFQMADESLREIENAPEAEASNVSAQYSGF